MKRYQIRWLVSVVVGGLAAAGIAETGTEEEAIFALEREWSSRFAQGDVDWIVAAHAPDAQQFPPNAPPVVGLDALRAAWQGMADTEGLSLSWQPTRAYVSSSGDMAWDHGTGKLTNPDGRTQDVKYVVVWHRIDGEWKIVMDMFSPNSP
jgi:ketosteroid isomerase-like protein